MEMAVCVEALRAEINRSAARERHQRNSRSCGICEEVPSAEMLRVSCLNGVGDQQRD